MDRNAESTGGMSAQNYRALMRHQAGAVTVVATGSGPGRAGLTATAFSSLSDSPPTVLVCVQHNASAHDVIATSRVFTVNILASNQQDIAERFSGRDGINGVLRFDGSSWTKLTTGAPVLENALAVLDCELVESHRFTTHTIFIGHVVDGTTRHDGKPLLYFRGDYWNLGSK